MSRRKTFPSKEMLVTPAYTASRAPRSVGAYAETQSTLPPEVTTLPSATVVPAWKATTSIQIRGSSSMSVQVYAVGATHRWVTARKLFLCPLRSCQDTLGRQGLLRQHTPP